MAQLFEGNKLSSINLLHIRLTLIRPKLPVIGGFKEKRKKRGSALNRVTHDIKCIPTLAFPAFPGLLFPIITMYRAEMQSTLMPRTIDRLLVTSMVLTGSTLSLTIGTIHHATMGNMILNAIVSLILIAVMTNHFVLYHLSKKQITAFSPSADGTVAYPDCLFGLLNIIFTSIAGMLLIGLMWMAISSGIFHWITTWTPSGDNGHYPALALILQGLIGYVEAGVLLTLFVLCVRQRRVHLRRAREGIFKA